MPDEKEKKKTSIEGMKNGPFVVKNLERFRNSRNESLPVQPATALCRCGGSKHKPRCDGTHAEIGFDSGKQPDRVRDRVKDYVGGKITIHDNRGVCSHSEECIRNSPTVFRKHERPWIDPDGADVEEIVSTIRKCPSGALFYTLDGKTCKDFDREPAIKVSKNGPLEVVGSIDLKDHAESSPESKEHYTLCRCGGSKNKPFCDGTHWHNGFKDEEN